MKTFGTVYFIIITACAFVQFGMGGSPLLVLALYLIAATGLVVTLPGGQNLPSLIYFACTLYAAGFALPIKTLLLQPVQQNLMAPFDTALVLLGGHVCLTIAYVIYRTFPARLAVFNAMEKEFSTPSFLKFIAWFGFVIGFALMVLHTIFRPKFVNGVSTAEGFGGFGAFYFLLVMAFTAQCALAVIERHRGRNLTVAIVMFAFIFALSLMGNQKKYILDAALIVSLTLIAYNVKIRPQYIIFGVVFLAFTQFIVSPLIHIARSESSQKTISERIDLTVKILDQNNYDFGKINQINDRVTRSLSGSYRSSGSYIYPSTLNLDRFTLVLPVDQVVRVGESGRTGWSVFVRTTLERILPGAFIEKHAGSLTDEVAWTYGFRQAGVVARPVTGLTATSWAIGGIAGLVSIGIVVPLLLFWVLGIIGGPITRNPWTIAMLVVSSLAPEQDSSGILGLILRDLPIALAAVGVLMLLTRGLRYQQPRPTPMGYRATDIVNPHAR
ncbi:MAG: hypothetical protein EBR82_08350 [Caulobacteraceae bacterium]|nr:hypothetical protein [Caulobacteraceae bacterium]